MKKKRWDKKCIKCGKTYSWYRKQTKAGWVAGCNQAFDRKHEFLTEAKIEEFREKKRELAK
jgi:hypothetical protein